MSRLKKKERVPKTVRKGRVRKLERRQVPKEPAS